MGFSIEKLQFEKDRNLKALSFVNARAALYRKYADKLIINQELTRQLVSFQANKSTPFYRWLKYKEAFSSEFVRYVLNKFKPASNSIPYVLDPFAGAGTTLTT
ncbi:MAG: DNA methyltransferase, partial [Deltaproteobacteria bacterium]|nr:DNA methyltransferase [Deltaproteobacteria bacterium]